MSSMMSDAAEWMASQMQSHLAVPINYRRGGTTLTGINATPGAAQNIVDETTGIVVFRLKDWLIPVSVLTLGEPKRNDVIEFNGETYKVLPPVGEDCWRWSDNHNTIYRIHSERIKA